MTSEQFHSRYLSLAPTLYKVAFYILESEEEAKDAVQDAFVKLWKDRESLYDVANPKAYCIRLVKNLCLDRIRRQTGYCEAWEGRAPARPKTREGRNLLRPIKVWRTQ